MMDSGKARHVVNSQVFDSWFDANEPVALTAVEALLLQTGPDWGFRQGSLVEQTGSIAQYVITDDGAQRAQGSKRWLTDSQTKTERGWDGVPLISNVPSSVMAVHPNGDFLRNADDIP